jgi:hypothetical protein
MNALLIKKESQTNAKALVTDHTPATPKPSEWSEWSEWDERHGR